MDVVLILVYMVTLQMSNSSKAKVCFVMFVDQKSLDVVLEEGKKPNDKGDLGLWKIVLIKNLPYLDGRRNGKVPKLLTHRLFPNARLMNACRLWLVDANCIALVASDYWNSYF